MALVSPGLQITVTDESQYIPAAVGTVPLVVLATAENKTFAGGIASGTLQANAGALQSFASQRELVAALGYPKFQQSSAGTPLHGNEQNEYGLMTAYSALGLGNNLYAIRADIDLDQLTATSIRPTGKSANGTFWLDLANSSYGINEWSASTQSFTSVTPIVITSSADVTLISGVPTPNSNIGTIGSYAIVVRDPNNYVFYKNSSNIWVKVGSAEWQQSFATITGSVISSPVVTTGSEIVINGTTVTVVGTTVADVISAINAAAIDGVTAVFLNGRVVILGTSDAASDGSSADGRITISDGSVPVLGTIGLTAGTYYVPLLSMGTYVQVPSWRSSDVTPRPTGSVYIKTSVLGNGAEFSFKEYDAANDLWTPVAAQIYASEVEAINDIDVGGGGFGIQAGTVVVIRDSLENGTATFRPFVRAVQGSLKVTGAVPTSSPLFTIGDSFVIRSSYPSTLGMTTTVITLSGTTSADFVSNVLAANIPYVTATLEANGAISLTHTAGGVMILENTTGTPLTTAGFSASVANIRAGSVAGTLVASNFSYLTYTYSMYTPYTSPADGTMWYYGSATEIDVMINDATGWRGYKNVSNDARGYNLVNTDSNGVIVSPIEPTTQTDNSGLVSGDLWLDSSDLVNYPKIYRYNGSGWDLIDNSDRVSQNGIVFADARWDAAGTVDPITGSMPSVVALQTSDYVDLDAPDHRLYPRGTLLFNTRRSGFNVKKYLSNYFSSQNFPNQSLPTQKGTWVSASGLREDGSPYMGSSSQRRVVVAALRAAIDGNTQIREDNIQFSLIVCPGYPEMTSNMVALNNDRANTSFVIGDTPMTLKPNAVDLAAWNSSEANTASEYLGVFYPSGLSNDVQGNTIVMPPSHMALRTIMRSDNLSYPWFAPAGVHRGLIDNANDIGYINETTGGFVTNRINQGLRDTLYSMNINPLTVLPAVGLVNWGQKTRSGSASAMDRINVARLISYIRTIFAAISNNYLFEPNDQGTRDQVKRSVEGALNDLVSKRGLYEYVVVCDSTNNTPSRIARNELYVDVAIAPMKDIEFIYVPIRLRNPGELTIASSAI